MDTLTMERNKTVFTIKEIKKLLRYNPTLVYEPDRVGLTPLMVAAKHCDPVCLTEILQVGYGDKTVDRLDKNQLKGCNEHLNEKSVLTVGGNRDAAEEEKGGNESDGDDDEEEDSQKYIQSNNDDDDEEDSQKDIKRKDDDDDDDDDDDEEEEDGDEWNMDDITNKFDRYCWEQEEKFYKLYSKKYGKNIDFRDREGLTAFQHCVKAKNVCINKQITCLQLLAKAGADLKLENDCGQRPIEVAIDEELDGKVVSCLCDLGCEILPSEDYYHAQRKLNLPLMKIFRDRGANVHAQNHIDQNSLHYLLANFDTNQRQMDKFETILKVLVDEFKVDTDSYNQYSSVFSVAFCLYAKGTSFPLHYLMSENVDVLSSSNIMPDNPVLDVRQKRAVRRPMLEMVQFLYDYNMPRALLLRFIGTEPDSVTRTWLESVYGSPPSLSKICKFFIRRCLGKDIKSKVRDLNVPLIIQDIILLKDILSSRCFE